MKKLLCVAILCLGLFTMGSAQTLKWEITNTTTKKWYWACDDAGPSGAQYELLILPNETRFGGISNTFAFPLVWKAGTYTNPNCYVTTTDGGPVLATTLPTACPGVTVTYKIVQMIPFVFYLYKANLG